MKKIAIISGGGIGDFIVISPLLKIIGARNDYQVFIITKNKRSLFGAVKQIKVLTPFNPSLYLKRFDVLFRAFGRDTFLTKILFQAIRAKRKIICKESGKNIVLRYNVLLEELQINKRGWRWELPFSVENKREKFGFSKEDFIVALHSGSLQTTPTRIWPAERWAAVCDELIRRYKARIVFLGGTSDKEEIAKIQKMMAEESLDLSGLDLRESFNFIYSADIFLSVNAGLMWAAAALNKPQVALCGPSWFGWEPYNEKAKVVRKIIQRRHCNPPCDMAKCKYKDTLCMHSINTAEVKKALVQVIGKYHYERNYLPNLRS